MNRRRISQESANPNFSAEQTIPHSQFRMTTLGFFLALSMTTLFPLTPSINYPLKAIQIRGNRSTYHADGDKLAEPRYNQVFAISTSFPSFPMPSLVRDRSAGNRVFPS